MPPHLEKVRDKLAENIHELWGMNKIELGWSYGKVRVRLLMRLLFSCLCCSPTSSSLGSKDKKHTPCRFPCLWRNKHDNYNFFLDECDNLPSQRLVCHLAFSFIICGLHQKEGKWKKNTVIVHIQRFSTPLIYILHSHPVCL